MKNPRAVFAVVAWVVLLLATAPAGAQQPISVEQRAALAELAEAMNMRKTLQDTLKLLQQSMPAQLKQQIESMLAADPRLKPAQRAQLQAKLDEELPAMVARLQRFYDDPALISDLLDAILPIYASYFSADEIRQLGAFYRTPLGTKMIEALPRISNDSMRLSMQIMAPRLGKLTSDMMEDLRQRAAR